MAIDAVKPRNGIGPSLQMVAFEPFCITEAKAFARKREVMCMGLVWVSNATRFRRQGGVFLIRQEAVMLDGN